MLALPGRTPATGPGASALILLLFLAPAAVTQVEFNWAEAMRLEAVPHHLAHADFNGDGKLDLAGLRSARVALLLSNPTGGYESSLLSIDEGGRSIAAGEFTGDGNTDLAVVGYSDLFLYAGNGTGDFTLSLTLLLGNARDDLQAVDVNDDAIQDLVLFDRFGRNVDVYVADGSGGFLDPTTLIGPPSMKAVGSGHFDGDSLLDLVLVGSPLDESGDLRVALGDGSGSFVVGPAFQVLPAPSAVSVGDLDEDGNTDVLVLSNSTPTNATAAYGDGEGGFDRSSPIVLSEAPHDSVLVDLDEDGHLDLAHLVSDFSFSGYLAVAHGDGSGNFANPVGLGLRQPPALLDVADIEGDGSPELLTVHGMDASIIRASGDRRYATNQVLLGEPDFFGSVNRRRLIATDDLDGDGCLDLLSLSDSTARLSYFPGSVDGRFGNEIPIMELSSGRFARLESVNLNGDQRSDLIVTQVNEDEILLILDNDGTGFFPPVRRTLLDTVETFLIADVNGDTYPDFLAEHPGDRIEVYLGAALNPFTVHTPLTTGNLDFDPRPRDVGDLNGDGHLDLVVRRRSTAGSSRNRASVLLGNSTGTFTLFQHFTADGDGLLLDHDGDGRLDYVYVAEGDLQYRPGTGFGSFADPIVVSETDLDRNLRVADLDGNGTEDLVSYDPPSRQIHFAQRFPDRPPIETTLRLGSAPKNLALEDLDGDGEIDVAISHDDSSIWTYLGRNRLYACRRGNVNTGSGSRADVLFVNDSAGNGRARLIQLEQTSPLTIRMEVTPAGGSQFALYAWGGPTRVQDIRPLFLGVGSLCRPILFHGAPPVKLPREIWNNVAGFDHALGAATLPSTGAPSTVLDLAMIPRSGRFFLQGIIADPGAPNGLAGVTNAMEIVVSPPLPE